ncbi:MAG: glycosyltransferase [Bacteroidota bacterium]
MKHIIWLTPGFAADESDTKCIPPLQLLARQLATQTDMQLHIISLHYPYKQEKYQWFQTEVYPAYSSGPLSKIRTWWRAWTYIKLLLKKHPTAPLHSFWLNDAALLGQLACRFFGIKHRITLMGQDARPSNKYLKLFALSKLQLISLSPFHDDQLYASTGRRADKIIPWGIEKSAVQTAKTAENRAIDVLGVGNLIALKDYTTFLKIIAQIRPDYPNIKVVLIGDGVERGKLEQLAHQLNISPNVSFTGYLDRKKVLAYMRKSKVFLHTSEYESFGYVFLEALANGMQLVSRPVGIATAGKKWQVASKEELFSATLAALESPSDNQPYLPYTMEDCMKSYLAL